jgi:hypothetical protein
MTEAPTEVEMILLTVMRKAVADAKRALEADLHGLSAIQHEKLNKEAVAYFKQRQANTLEALARFKDYALEFEKEYMRTHWAVVRTPTPYKEPAPIA